MSCGRLDSLDCGTVELIGRMEQFTMERRNSYVAKHYNTTFPNNKIGTRLGSYWYMGELMLPLLLVRIIYM